MGLQLFRQRLAEPRRSRSRPIAFPCLICFARDFFEIEWAMGREAGFSFEGRNWRNQMQNTIGASFITVSFVILDLKGTILGIRLGHFRYGYSRLDV